MKQTIRRSAAPLLLILIALTLLVCPVHHTAAGGAQVLEVPIFLNGEPLYTQTGEASLLSIAADAARSALGTDIALLPASAVNGSLPAGSATLPELTAVIPPDEMLVTTEVVPAELAAALNEVLTYGSPLFPHVSGVKVQAQRVLDDAGQYAGVVNEILQGDLVIASASSPADGSTSYSSIDAPLTIVTTAAFAREIPWLTARAEETETSLLNAFIQYLERTPNEAIAYYADNPRLSIVSDTLYTELVTAKLALNVPSPVVVDLSHPDTIPDTVFFTLSGQDRYFTCRILDEEIPYALSVRGTLVDSPASVSSAISVTQTLPAARKTANTFDDNTVFVDLRYNDTIPPGTVVEVNLQGIYPSETLLHVYYYDENGDIVPADASVIVDADGWISFSVDPSTTYVLNSRELDSTAFELPSASRPYMGAALVIFGLFIVWAVLFIRKKGRRRNEAAA